MLQDERLTSIMEYLKINDRIDIETICEMNQVSRDTARRDLILLEEVRKVIRIRGGAKRPLLNNEIYNFEQRNDMASEAKNNIGKLAASLIQDGDHLILDASTTVQALAKYITGQNLTVVINSIDVASELSFNKNIKINVIGGTLSQTHRAIYGSRAIKNLSDYKVNKCFIGTCGITGEGISTSIEEEGLFTQEIIKRSDQVIVLADSTKFNKTFFQKVCSLDEIDVILTDQEVPEKIMKIIELHNVEVVVCK